MSQVHRETLEEEATHATDEARMLLPGVQAILGFQFVAVFNQRFEHFTRGEQILHLAALLMVALAMGLVMAPAAYHRQAEPGTVSRRFVVLASTLLTMAMVPFIAGVCFDVYLVSLMILADDATSLLVSAGVAAVLIGLWFALPLSCRVLWSR